MEQAVYNLLKNHPWLKDIVKKLYQSFFSLFGRKNEKGLGKLIIRPNSFFGFHDKSPWSADNKMLLAHQFSGIGNEELSSLTPIKIVLFDGDNWNNARVLGETRAWNWQQGSQLQWLGDNGHILFNDFFEGVCKAVEINNQGVQVKLHQYPVAAASIDGMYFASFCFKTFGEAMPGYGYDFKSINAKSNISPDTLLILDRAGEVKYTVRGEGLSIFEEPSFENGKTFISHTIFNKNATKLAFMRRAKISGRRMKSALYILDMESGEVKKVPFKNMVSHYCWLDEDTLFAYANTDMGDGYFKYNSVNDRLEDFSSVFGQADGHPHTDFSGEKLVFDSYPNRYRLQRLAIFDWKKMHMTELAKLYSPMKFWGNKRVDLHPRMRSDSKFVCIDCSSSGVRSLATLRVVDD